MPRDYYLQPDAPDPVLTSALVLRIARQYVPDARVVRAVEESGGEARTYAIDDGFILKVQRPQQLRPRTSLAKEVFFLRQIAADLPEVSVPRVIGHGREGAQVEYTLMTRMPGIAMRHATLDSEQRRAVLFQLGGVLRRIHSLPVGPFFESDHFPGDASFPDLQMRFGGYFMDVTADIAAERRPWHLEQTPEVVAARAVTSLPRTRVRAALHSNPYLEHVFIRPERGEFAGLIDFGDAFLSHPTFDFRRWSQPHDREALLAGYTADAPVSDDFLATWRVVLVLADLITMAYYPERGAAAEEDLRHLLREL